MNYPYPTDSYPIIARRNHALEVPFYGMAGCGAPGVMTQCGAPYGTPMGPYGLSDAAPAPPSAGGWMAGLPSWWPFAGLAVGGTLALVGVILMATKK